MISETSSFRGADVVCILSRESGHFAEIEGSYREVLAVRPWGATMSG
jgi:hypothetical protein